MTIEYSTKKTMVNGMLDVALMLSNASRLKTMLRQDCLNSIQCIVGVTFLIFSILLQIAIGIVLLILARREQRCRKRKRDCVESEADDKHEADCDDENQGELMEQDIEKKKKPLKRQLTIKEETDIMRKDKTTTKLNTAVLIAVFVVVVLNILMDGLDLGLPETEKTKA